MRREWIITGQYPNGNWEWIDHTDDMSPMEAEQYVIDTYPDLEVFEITARETVHRVEKRTTWHQV